MVFPETGTLVLLYRFSIMTADYFKDMGLQESKVIVS